MALNVGPGAKLTKLKFNMDAFAQIRTTPETEDLLDKVASTIANAAKREAGKQVDDDVDVKSAEFYVDGNTSPGRRGRYRASVRTGDFEAIWAEYRYNALTRGLVEFAGKFDSNAKQKVGRAIAVSKSKPKPRKKR